VEPVVLPKFLPKVWGLTMAYVERRERKKGVRYWGVYKAADGRYRSAGRFSTGNGRCPAGQRLSMSFW
jgi:hypothetical protein